MVLDVRAGLGSKDDRVWVGDREEIVHGMDVGYVDEAGIAHVKIGTFETCGRCGQSLNSEEGKPNLHLCRIPRMVVLQRSQCAACVGSSTASSVSTTSFGASSS